MNTPEKPAEIAKLVTRPEMAAEMYLASLLIADEHKFICMR